MYHSSIPSASLISQVLTRYFSDAQTFWFPLTSRRQEMIKMRFSNEAVSDGLLHFSCLLPWTFHPGFVCQKIAACFLHNLLASVGPWTLQSHIFCPQTLIKSSSVCAVWHPPSAAATPVFLHSHRHPAPRLQLWLPTARRGWTVEKYWLAPLERNHQRNLKNVTRLQLFFTLELLLYHSCCHIFPSCVFLDFECLLVPLTDDKYLLQTSDWHYYVNMEKLSDVY